MGEQIVSICGNSSDQGKNKADALVLPSLYRVLEKLGFSIYA